MNEEELARMEAEVTQRLQRHYVRHKGAQEPQRIPLPERMRSFFSLAAEGSARDPEGPAGWLAARMTLSDGDRHAMIDAIRKGDTVPANVQAVYASTYALTRRLTETEDVATVMGIARRLDSLQGEAEALYTAHFESVLAPMSADGRRSFDEYVAREIVPQTSCSRTNHAALYADMIELLPQIKELQAHGRLTLRLREENVSSGAFVGSSSYY
jgi:hypothetical protein